MTTYIALLRAVNVGGTGKFPMADLRTLCEAANLANVRTYIASGNVVFESPLPEHAIKAALEGALASYAGKPVGVVLRTAQELARALADNPFTSTAPNRTVIIFLDDAVPAAALDGVRGQRTEEIALGRREIYVHYGDGMAGSKLTIAAAKTGTARNVNTVARLVEMAGA